MGHLGVGVLVNLLKLLATFYVAVAVFIGAVLLPVALIARVPLRRFAGGRSRAGVDRLCHHQLRSGAAPRDGGDGEAGRAAADRGVRHAHRLQLQPGRQHAVSVAGRHLRGAGRGRHLSFGQQFLLLTLMLTSKGVAGVPRGALVILLGTVGSFGLPTEPVFMILGIDALMDMLRTSLNVLGNCLATVVIARWEGEFDDRASAGAST